MASYSLFPRPEPPPAEQSAASRAHSRFVEGSMNDRVSNAPPPTFLGPEEMAAYERQFYANVQTRSRPTSGSEQSFNKTSGSSFWGGLREKLHISRTRSSNSITTVSSNKSKLSNRYSQQSQIAAAAPNEKENVAHGYYPSKDEVMENYKSLVDAGFFSSHAIHGTRHQPPPSRALAKSDRPLPAPPPPTRDAPPAPFSELVAQKRHQLQQQTRLQDNSATPALASNFASIPYSATQVSPTGDAPLMKYPRPDPRPPLSLPKKYRQPCAAATHMAPPVSPRRGTKRGMADMTGGSVDREVTMANAGGIGEGAEAGARKLVKKLRKSASRISADLSLRPMTSSSNSGSPYGMALPGGSSKDVRGTASSTSINLVPRPPISSANRAMGMVRSLSSSFKRDGGPKMAAVGGGVAAAGGGRSPPTASSTTTTPTPNKLSKAKRSLGRRASLSRSRSGSMSSSSFPVSIPTNLPPPPVPPHRQPQQAPVIPYTDPEPLPRTSTPSSNAQRHDDGDPMVLDSDAEPPTRNPSLDVFQPGGLSVPSFHYPQRQKVLPLAVVPDANCGIPAVPVVPREFAGKGGDFCFGIGDPGVGSMRGSGLGEDGEKENFGGF